MEADYEIQGETYQQAFNAVTLSKKSLDSNHTASISWPKHVMRLIHNPQSETTRNTQPNCTLRLKIDIGASGNTSPMRTFCQMYGTPASHSLKPANNVRLTAYNGSKIECHGKIDIKCSYRGYKWVNATLSVVDVPGPAVVGQ